MNFKKILGFGLATMALTTSVFATDLENYTDLKMEVECEVTPRVTMLDVTMPLRLSVAIDATETRYDDMFYSPDIAVVNNTEGREVELRYSRGDIAIGADAMTLVAPNYHTDWENITVEETISEIALGAGHRLGHSAWGEDSALNSADVWFVGQDITLGVVPAPVGIGYSKVPSESEFQLVAKHGVRFVEPVKIDMDLYFIAELVPLEVN